MAAFLAEQEGVTDVTDPGLGPKGELTPFRIVGVGKLCHPLKTLGDVALPTVLTVQAAVWSHLRPQT
eukprot:5697538-Pyramimonas_sp.AAC.1